ncbi:hypothetical protein MKW98_030035 [Papaver atlanticum]|uniref:Uncharacterized protein n=1 Tax=Papaver atlanticum TaxID=357466 RepID=A0AAD4T7J7_9MAGN|nr:hypothetical protein MKW98_030035 [Papaver atlanticum]
MCGRPNGITSGEICSQERENSDKRISFSTGFLCKKETQMDWMIIESIKKKLAGHSNSLELVSPGNVMHSAARRYYGRSPCCQGRKVWAGVLAVKLVQDRKEENLRFFSCAGHTYFWIAFIPIVVLRLKLVFNLFWLRCVEIMKAILSL